MNVGDSLDDVDGDCLDKWDEYVDDVSLLGEVGVLGFDYGKRYVEYDDEEYNILLVWSVFVFFYEFYVNVVFLLLG